MSSTSSSQTLPIDFSTLKFNPPILEENSPDSEHAFTTGYTFTVKNPNPPPPPVEEEQEPDPVDLSDPVAVFLSKHKFKYTPPPEPLVNVVVKTIDRTKIPAGEFYLYMDEYSEDFLQFSMGVFNKSGRIKPSLHQVGSPHRGTGVWGPEINRGTIAYIEEIRVNPRYQRQGVGRWVIENVLKSDALAHCPFFFLWATVINTRGPFDGPDPEFDSKKQIVLSFWRSVGFRRVGGTWFFGYARNPQHPMRSLKAEDDGVAKQTKDFTPLDAFNASVNVIG